MKILNFPQYSMFNGTGFEINRDSTTAVYKVLKKYIGNEHKLIQLIPEGQFSNSYSDDYMPYKLSNSPLIQRYEFDSSLFIYTITAGEFDMVFNHIPELARNMRACMPELPIISFHHFPDIGIGLVPNEYSYFPRQIDGYQVSDMNVFNMETNRLKFLEAANVLDSTNSFSISYLDTDLYVRKDKRVINHKLTVFPGRITSTNYNNWETVVSLFIEADGELGQLVLTNPSGKYGMKAFFDKYQNKLHDTITIYPEGINGHKYMEICQQANAVISLYENEFYGGLAIREAILWGHVIPIILHVHEFAKWNNLTGISPFKALNDLTVNSIKQYMELVDIEAYYMLVKNEDYKFHRYKFDKIWK